MKQARKAIHKHATTALVAIAAAAVTAGGPAIARTVADFARDAHKVDGRHAVGAGASQEKRMRKLVATNRRGYLPNDIIRKAKAARNADRLGHRRPNAYAMNCGQGVLRGHAIVPADIGPDYEPVVGFATMYGGPVGPDGSNCHSRQATAKRVSTGVYRVDVVTAFDNDCPAEAPERPILGATTTVMGSDPSIATYVPVCEQNAVVPEVHITDPDGTPVDAGFSITLFDENGVPIP